VDLVSLVPEETLEVDSGLTTLPVDPVVTEVLEEELSTMLVF
jgi:hypothetical protein